MNEYVSFFMKKVTIYLKIFAKKLKSLKQTGRQFLSVFEARQCRQLCSTPHWFVAQYYFSALPSINTLLETLNNLKWKYFPGKNSSSVFTTWQCDMLTNYLSISVSVKQLHHEMQILSVNFHFSLPPSSFRKSFSSLKQLLPVS